VSRLRHVSCGFAYNSPYTLTPGQPTPGLIYHPASPYGYPPRICQFARRQPLSTSSWTWRGYSGTGISTSCASTTPFGLALAPDSPWADYPSPGTLAHSEEGFLTPLSLLIPTFSLVCSPRRLPPSLHRTHDAPLPIFRSRSFGTVLEPRYIIRAGSLDQ
jgi:hypothetical protein